jgi:hypothetical protein
MRLFLDRGDASSLLWNFIGTAAYVQSETKKGGDCGSERQPAQEWLKSDPGTE